MNTLEDVEGMGQTAERELGLPSGFFMRLRHEDDWSFVIKAHALVESAITHLLVNHSGDSRLSPVFRRLALANSSVGKLAFVSALDLLPQPQRGFVAALARLRNRLAHDIHQVSFRFSEWPEIAVEPGRSELLSPFVYYGRPEIRSPKEWVAWAANDPKFAIWWGMLGVLLKVCLGAADARARKRIAENNEQFVATILTSSPPREARKDAT